LKAIQISLALALLAFSREDLMMRSSSRKPYTQGWNSPRKDTTTYIMVYL
jgi:hypothetical protein